MERKKQWKITLWMQYLVLVLAIVLLSIVVFKFYWVLRPAYVQEWDYVAQ